MWSCGVECGVVTPCSACSFEISTGHAAHDEPGLASGERVGAALGEDGAALAQLGCAALVYRVVGFPLVGREASGPARGVGVLEACDQAWPLPSRATEFVAGRSSLIYLGCRCRWAENW